jgi:uncharacterized surface protein with fasciclin (FAS1) repeats
MLYRIISVYSLAIFIIASFFDHVTETVAVESSPSSRTLQSFLQRKQRNEFISNAIERSSSLDENFRRSIDQFIPLNRMSRSNTIASHTQFSEKTTSMEEDVRRQLRRRKYSIFSGDFGTNNGSNMEGKGKGGDVNGSEGKGGKEKPDSKGSTGKGSAKEGKGKGGDDVEGGKGKGGSGSSKGEPSKICKNLDFRDLYYGKIFGKGGKGEMNSNNGKGKRRRERQLQFEGENCSPNALETARKNPNLSIYVDAIEQAGLEEIFDCAGPFTVLAPTNAAFQKNPALLDFLLTHPNKLQQVLLYSIVPGFFLTTRLEPGPLETLLGENVMVKVDPTRFNQAGVVDSDILACNGVINTIDDVLLPPGKFATTSL